MLALIGILAVAVVALTAAGLFGIVAEMVRQRRRELGVRLAIGATPRQVSLRMLRDGVALALMGMVPGAMLAPAAGRMLRRGLEGADGFTPGAFAAAGAALVLLAAAACLLPAWRAGRVDPITVLREDWGRARRAAAPPLPVAGGGAPPGTECAFFQVAARRRGVHPRGGFRIDTARQRGRSRPGGEMVEDPRKQLTKYLTDAHSIEEQALQQLRTAPDIAGEPSLAQILREHLAETEGHERRVRALLEDRGNAPSSVKDVVMRAGGTGFVLFARSQPDTPGKLATHALSYEALEWASYDLLARTAERLGEQEVADVARSIRDEERRMMERIEGVFDQTVAASLAVVARDDLKDNIRTYLADAHAIEAQSIQLLQSGSEMVEGHPPLAALFDEHLAESRTQQQLLEERLEALGGGPSWLKDAAMRAGALNWGTFFLGHPDTAAKLAGFAYAFEHLEIGGYEQLRRVAERAGDAETVATVSRVLAQERRTAERLAGAFDAAVEAALEEQGVR